MKCKNCKFWDFGNRCDRICIRINDYSNKSNEQSAEINIRVLDDSGLDAFLVTSPNFGCSLWEKDDNDDE